VAQFLLTTVVVFLLYRFVVQRLGIEAIGVWSVVFAFTALGRVADFGFSSAVTRFVAREVARGDTVRAADYVRVAALCVVALYSLLGVILAWVGIAIMPILLPGQGEAGRALLPYAVAAFWLSGLSSVPLAALEGLQRIDLRSIFTMAGSLLLLIVATTTAGSRGIVALGIAQVAQAALLLLASAVAVLSMLPRARTRGAGDGPIVRELLIFGTPLQAISISVLLFEPLTKLLLSRFGTLSAVGYYEMASRLVQQARAIVVGANQILVPAMAEAFEVDRTRAYTLYAGAYRLAIYLALLVGSATVAIVPLISEVWLGRYEGMFVAFAGLLAVGWSINIAAAPAYFSAIGAGTMRANLIGHLVIGIVNVIVGATLGMAYGSIGVVIGAALALVSGSLTTLWLFHHEREFDHANFIPREDLSFLVFAVAGAIIALLAYYALRPALGLAPLMPLVVLVYLSVAGWSGWQHWARRRITGGLFGRGGGR
jgi:O-antigen/teichoic acid export membrane protein